MKAALTQSSDLKTLLKNEPLVAAPMAGITNRSFRKILRKFTRGLIYTEMVSVEGLKRQIDKTVDYIRLTPEDNPIIVQLFGFNENSFHDAVKITEEISSPYGFDINMGCPVKKVLKTGGGSNLLKNIKQAERIIKNARKATEKKLTVKIRLGWDRENLVFRELIKMAENEGVDAVCIHARTKSELFTGEVDYGALETAAELAKIPVIGNGNVCDPSGYKRMLNTGVSGVMIGRAIMKTPWIFQALRENKHPENFLSKQELYNLLMELKDFEYEEKGAHYINLLKKYAVFFSKSSPGASNFRNRLYSTNNEKESLKIIENFFNSNT
ncbi:dihydrouridine synthase DuS [Flexistipes sinusarabici DSM 4947]|uniref:tRNA-dihydrouridine synthase n=1 Tax=Flexistipes sinusarabici (strain ATCC 49648 / DSM 4947 / MAS 10) TaxID=717231 RepID=F8E7V1_FLESM|nr:tRNA-dihydrouridine synthase family protein [Flexistipes sinusarabici]AEI15019.1 dihydrouridine synthase DuS [Flexistipes sinusarabici DSM 4947]